VDPLRHSYVIPGPLLVKAAETDPSLDQIVPETKVETSMLVHPEIGTTPALPVTGSLVVLPKNFIPNDSARTLPVLSHAKTAKKNDKCFEYVSFHNENIMG
jgi:hypothetical protein